MQLSHGAVSDQGRKRSENQDSLLIDFDPQQYPSAPALFVVCDGVGGAQAGKTASSLAVEQVREAFRSATERNLARRLITAADRASAVIFEQSKRDPSTEGMATTLVAAAFDAEKCYIVNVGDSRAYLIRQGQIEKVTVDHTLIQDQINNGLITADQAASSPYRHVITRSLGRQAIDVGAQEYVPVDLKAGDVFVLCSDGLTDMVSGDEIRAVAATHDPSKAAQALVDLANDHGGRDNVTVVVVRVEQGSTDMASTMKLPIVQQDSRFAPTELYPTLPAESPDSDFDPLATTMKLPVVEEDSKEPE